MTNRQTRFVLGSALALGAIVLPEAPASAQVACPSRWQAAQTGTVAQRRQKLNAFLASCPRHPLAAEARRQLSRPPFVPVPDVTIPTPTPNPDALPNRGTLLPSGVRVEVVRQGNGVAVGPTDTVLLRYRLTRLSGQLVSENMRAQEPLRFPLRPDVRGFGDALANLRLGSIVYVWVPRALRSTGPGVPPGANHSLAYLVEIAGVIPAGGQTPAELTAAAIAMREALAAVPANEWMTFDMQVFAGMEGRLYTLGTLADMRALAAAGTARAQFLVGRALDMGALGATQNRPEALAYYRRAAAAGDANAQTYLGYLLSTPGAGASYSTPGAALDIDNGEARRLYELAAAQGHAGAQANLGIIYRDGIGVARNYERAIALFTQAMQANFPPGFTGLAFHYSNGWGVPKNDAEAARLIREGATRGDPVAQLNLGAGLYQGMFGLPQNQTEGLMWLRRAAAAGSQPARDYLTQRNLPLTDSSAPPPISLAIQGALAAISASEWMTGDMPTFLATERRIFGLGSLADMRALAEAGNPRAQFYLARALQTGGFGAQQDLAQAIEWYRRAATAGDPLAQYQLAFFNANGVGMPQNQAEGLRLYELAAGQGHGVAQFQLGLIYRDGIGRPADPARAMTYFLQATERNFAPAFTSVGLMHGTGGIGAVNMPEAVRWFRRAAALGDTFGQATLGMILYDGAPGVAQERAEGLRWLRQAAAAGDQNATTFLTQRNLPLTEAVAIPGPFTVYFDWDQDVITPSAAAILDNVVTAWQRLGNASARVNLAGHTDRELSADYSMSMSQRRANNVRAYLSAHGIPESVISTEAYGENRPRVETPDGVREPQNRRVEITFGPAG